MTAGSEQSGPPAYGDQHPRFGLPGGENAVPQPVEFLRELFAISCLAEGRRPVVAFEVKPLPHESSGAVIANAKRTLFAVWGRLSVSRRSGRGSAVLPMAPLFRPHCPSAIKTVARRLHVCRAACYSLS